MTDPDSELENLKKRYERERRARREAESIAENVTAQLYATGQELEVLNAELGRTNDELQEVNRSMRDFVAIASHDLRNPLTSIIGYSEMLTGQWERLTEEARREFVAVIRRQGGHLNHLVDDLLTVSKIEAGALDVHADVVKLGNVMSQAIEGFTQRASTLTVEAPADLVALVDPEHLYRILTNYVTNAFKYGAPPVAVEARAAGEWAEITVRDHGVGVPAEFLPRLFGRFSRSQDAATQAQKGSGLGLSIVRGLAEANGGDTWYEPNEPSGSCFGVRLPRPV